MISSINYPTWRSQRQIFPLHNIVTEQIPRQLAHSLDRTVATLSRQFKVKVPLVSRMAS